MTKGETYTLKICINKTSWTASAFSEAWYFMSVQKWMGLTSKFIAGKRRHKTVAVVNMLNFLRDTYIFNPCRNEFIFGNIKIWFNFLSFFNIRMTQAAENICLYNCIVVEKSWRRKGKHGIDQVFAEYSRCSSRNGWCVSSQNWALVIKMRLHDDIIKWKPFTRNRPFGRGIHRWILITKASDTEVWWVF